MRHFFPGREQFVQLTIFPPGALRTRGRPKGTKTGFYCGKSPLRIHWESWFFGSQKLSTIRVFHYSDFEVGL